MAVLVKGNWVIRSECLYAKDTVSPHNGVSAEFMCRARDYIVSNKLLFMIISHMVETVAAVLF